MTKEHKITQAYSDGGRQYPELVCKTNSSVTWVALNRRSEIEKVNYCPNCGNEIGVLKV